VKYFGHMLSKRRSERKKVTVLGSPELVQLRKHDDYRLDQLERDQSGIGAFDTSDIADDILEESESDTEMVTKRKRPRHTVKTGSTSKQIGTRREKRSLHDLLVDENNQTGDTFLSVLVKPSSYPSKLFCSVCLLDAKYKCLKCPLRYCSLACRETHSETQCVKFSD
jgi:zinc finger HIT domain-containing protein 1